jgi:hypothetical protein
MPWWVPLVAGLLGGSFALGGVALGQHLTRQLKREERLDERRLEQRDVLVGLIDALEHWTPQAEMASLFFGKATANDMMEWVDTDSGKALRESVRDLERILVRCRLIVTDDELRPLVMQVVEAIRRLPDDINGPILAAAKRGEDPMEHILASIRYYSEVKSIGAAIQETALRRLTTSTGEYQPGPTIAGEPA